MRRGDLPEAITGKDEELCAGVNVLTPGVRIRSQVGFERLVPEGPGDGQLAIDPWDISW